MDIGKKLSYEALLGELIARHITFSFGSNGDYAKAFITGLNPRSKACGSGDVANKL